ncbi:hypothetical protein M407DRAFT_159490 [Tulasnella calospora MUT 4182]|uniref:Uncharacterized protein n=1 Tax=Tulasnella calospora MUT 4182 TaxID=1051891 RepID=A0A0C3L823_9AGAM|nr:hypothetical protein M407DRAFT_159490 [Tulasnella calospora MUT 4182]
MAVKGKFGDASTSGANSSSHKAHQARKISDVTLLVQGIRNRVLRLYSQCEALFSIIFPDSPSRIQELEDEFEGGWLEAMESISDIRSEIRATAEKGNQRSQRLQFFLFIVEQMRHGHYSPGQWAEAMKGQHLEEFMSRPFVSKPWFYTTPSLGLNLLFLSEWTYIDSRARRRYPKTSEELHDVRPDS